MWRTLAPLLESLEFRVTQHHLVALLNRLMKKLRTGPVKAALSDAQAQKIRRAMAEGFRVLQAEAAQRVLFAPTPTRMAEDRLLNDPAALFGRGVYGTLPEIAQYDFREAGRCVAVGRATAACFHALRGTEGVLRAFYKAVVKRNRLNEQARTWYGMVDHMRKRSEKYRPPASLLEDLDQIRRHQRNGTMHPEFRYGMDDAEDIFTRCIGVVNQMAKSLTA